MTIAGERSKGKVRPRQVRHSDLQAMPQEPTDRARHRDSAGRFTPGNPGGLGRGAIAPVRRMLGDVETTDTEARTVARDAARLFSVTLAELPNDGPTVRQLVALFARHTALGSFWTQRAAVAGLGTDEGIKAQEQATKHGQRAERVAVTMLDVARSLAGAAASKPAEVDYSELFAAKKAT